MGFRHLCCAEYRGSLDNASHYAVVWMQCSWASPCSTLSFFPPWCLSFSSSFTVCWSSLHVQTLCLSWELPGGSGCVCTAARSWLPLECLPQSLVFLGDSTCAFFFFFFFFPHCITYELCCLPLWDWELRLMSTEHSSGYFVAAQRNSEGRQKLFRALTLASGGEMTWNITSDFLLKTLSTDTVKWQNQSQRKNVSMSQFGSWILHTPSKTKLKSALSPKPGSREVEPMLL